jgi:hypothetical protein
MSIDMTEFRSKYNQTLVRLERTPDVHEKQFPPAVHDRCHRAALCLKHAFHAAVKARLAEDYEYTTTQMALAQRWLLKAEHELSLADELIRELGPSLPVLGTGLADEPEGVGGG